MANTVAIEEENGPDVTAPITKAIEIPEINHIRVGTVVTPRVEQIDPFSKTAEEVKKMVGLTPVFKRRVTNEIKKVLENQDSTAKSKQLTLKDVTAYNAFACVTPPFNMEYLAKLYELSSPHKSAVDAKVSNIVGLGYDFTETPKTKRLLEDMEGNENKLKRSRKSLQRGKEDLLNFIDSLNKDSTFTETLMKVWTDYETMGNGYIEVGRKKDGSIGYLGHLPAAAVRVRKDRDGFVQMVSSKVAFFRNFGDNNTPNPFGNDSNPNEVIHLLNYSPTSAFYGVPDVVSAIQAIVGNEFSARFNLDYFENKAVPRHVIILKGATLSTPTENALLQFFETGLKGQNHRTLYIPLPPESQDNKVDLKIEPVEAGIQDSSFNNYKKQNLNEILMAHRVPITKVGIGEGISLAASRDADKSFKEQVCVPKQKNLEKKLNRIIKEITDAFALKLTEMSLTDAETQSKIDERAIKNQWTTPNEVRADQGKPGLKGGDKVVEQKPQQLAENRAQGTRERDATRSAGATDSAGEGRSTQGEGRSTP